MTSIASDSSFSQTDWTQVLAARGESAVARVALSDLCGAYYAPVVAFLRRSGREEDLARELAHEFFAHLLATNPFEGVERGRGRFRSYLLGALKHFLARRHEREQRQKHGGGSTSVPLDAGTDTSPGLALPDARTLPPDEFFDRQWALTVLDRALTALERAYLDTNRASDFNHLKPWLTGEAAHGDQSAVARALGLSEGAFKVAVHRVRRQFRNCVKAEIAPTVHGPERVAEEMAELFAALGGRDRATPGHR